MKLRDRPAVLKSQTFKVPTPGQHLFLTITNDDHGPTEVFLNIGKGGSEEQAYAEAIGRLISALLRLEEVGTPEDRLGVVVDQLIGIGGEGSRGFGADRVSSVPDAIAKVLKGVLEYSQIS
jgi:ribonucleoside-diphosphate reductase alpha chain